MKNKVRIIAAFLLMLTLGAPGARAFSFNLDSIAEMGKFPRFIVNTYRWGDQFFNGYDTTYVATTGYKFNAKITTQSWLDAYQFEMPNDTRIHMRSDPSTSLGVYVTYLAVSAGYDVNLNKLFTGNDRSRERFRFGFNCMLFGAELYFIKNDVGTNLISIGPRSHLHHVKLEMNGINATTWGIDAYYFFNHKRYSEAASFNFSRIQRRSQGAFYTGLSIYTQQLDFDFSSLPPELLKELPTNLVDYRYYIDTHNYAVRLGYGYNWVFTKNWVLGVSESPIIGVRQGYINSDIKKFSFSFYNRAKASVVWNNGKWFCGVIGTFDAAIVNEQRTSYFSGVLNGEAVFGYRFNLW